MPIAPVICALDGDVDGVVLASTSRPPFPDGVEVSDSESEPVGEGEVTRMLLCVNVAKGVGDDVNVPGTVSLGDDEPVCDGAAVAGIEKDGVGEQVGEAVSVCVAAPLGVPLGDAPLESVDVGVPVPVPVGVPVLELVGVRDVVPVAVTLAVIEAVSAVDGVVDGLAPRESVALAVELGEAVSDTVLDVVIDGDTVSLVVPLPVAVLLGVRVALVVGDALVVGETERVSGALAEPDEEAPLLRVAVGEPLSD